MGALGRVFPFNENVHICSLWFLMNKARDEINEFSAPSTSALKSKWHLRRRKILHYTIYLWKCYMIIANYIYLAVIFSLLIKTYTYENLEYQLNEIVKVAQCI